MLAEGTLLEVVAQEFAEAVDVVVVATGELGDHILVIEVLVADRASIRVLSFLQLVDHILSFDREVEDRDEWLAVSVQLGGWSS